MATNGRSKRVITSSLALFTLKLLINKMTSSCLVGVLLIVSQCQWTFLDSRKWLRNPALRLQLTASTIGVLPHRSYKIWTGSKTNSTFACGSAPKLKRYFTTSIWPSEQASWIESAQWVCELHAVGSCHRNRKNWFPLSTLLQCVLFCLTCLGLYTDQFQ